MAWFPQFRSKTRQDEKIHQVEKAPQTELRFEPKVEFLGEQKGASEDDLKRWLEPILRRHPSVKRAYLAVISTDGRKSSNVALCLASKEDRSLIHEVGAIFEARFNKDQVLDIAFVNHEFERALQAVCSPFYVNKDIYSY